MSILVSIPIALIGLILIYCGNAINNRVISDVKIRGKILDYLRGKSGDYQIKFKYEYNGIEYCKISKYLIREIDAVELSGIMLRLVDSRDPNSAEIEKYLITEMKTPHLYFLMGLAFIILAIVQFLFNIID